MKLKRRTFLKQTAFIGAGLTVPFKFIVPSASAAPVNSQPLRKWLQPLRGLGGNGIPVLDGTAAPLDPVFTGGNGLNPARMLQITAGEFLDQLHPDLPNPTRLWGYRETGSTVQRHLGGLIIARRGTPLRIRFTNVLPPTHILPVDRSLPGADQADNRIAIHLHGGLVPWISDGGPYDTWTPTGVGGLSFLNGPNGVLDNIPTMRMNPGQADYYYPNDQGFRLAWYHDHAHGTTRLNAYGGLASGFLILDDINDGYVAAGTLPGGASTFPLVFQDKIFVSATTAANDPTWATVAPNSTAPGSLWYDHIYDPRVFKLLRGKGYMLPPNPSCIPEFFGDTMLCNGTVYPYLEVEAKRYRFHALNACNARFLNLNLFQANPRNVDGIDLNTGTKFPMNPPGPNMIQIGTEGGFLAQEVVFVSPKPFNPATKLGNLILAPAERADVIIDFSGQAGKEFILYNDAPGSLPWWRCWNRLLPRGSG